ncbi:MAG: glycosyltransferase family 2 protein [Gallionella sp.]|nr:glycosyltransferase family 2 protein [Gallionella sp.]
MDYPLISICVTCFNAADTISRAIHSALEQEWPNKEIIIVDDCSTDGSSDLIQKIIDHNPSVRLIQLERNGGYPAALNTLVSEARGEFVVFFDDDDTSVACRVTAQWERITRYERDKKAEFVLCYSNRSVVVAGDQEVSAITRAIGRLEPEPYGPAVADFILLLLERPPFVWGQFGSCTLMMRREAILTLGGFDTEFRRGAEWDFAIHASLKGAHFIAVNESLVTQYLTIGSGNEKSGNGPLRHSLALRRKYRAFLRARGLFYASIAQAYARHHYARGNRTPKILWSLAAGILAPRTLLPHIVRKSRLFSSLFSLSITK